MGRFSLFILAGAAFLLFLSSPALAQSGRYDVRGMVVDSTDVGIPGATVVALAADSTILSFGITRNNGEFRIERVPVGEHLLQITFLGFQQHTESLTVSDEHVDVGTIVLHEAIFQFDELVVTGDHIPLLMRRDTLDYNAAAFRVPPNANVEELLRRLPGVDIDHDGTIRAQGEVVQRLLVDGREFFGTDPTVAMRNLPADAVERVQVYDRQSDTAELTGVDDGARERTMNLELKEDRRAGIFGNLSGAAGDPERYELRGTINRFSPGNQFSVIANANNINQTGFQISDVMSFSGGSFNSGMMQMMPLSSGASGGYSTTISGGINFNRDIGSSTTIQSSYLLYHLDRDQNVELFQRDVAGGPLSSDVTENSTTNDTQLNHRLRLDAEHTFSDGHELQLIANAQLGGTTSESQRFRTTERLEGDTHIANERAYNWNSNTLTGDMALTYRLRISPGRTIVAEARTGINRYDMDSHLETLSTFQSGNEITQEEIRQLQDQFRTQYTNSQEIIYTEPLGRRQLLEFEIEHRTVSENRDYDTFDIENGEPVINDPLSINFDRSYRQLYGSTLFRHSVDPLVLSFGVAVQHTSHTNPTLDDPTNFLHVLPRASLNYSFAQQTRLSMNYSTRTQEPSMREIQPFVENSDPLNIYVGNPEIQPTYYHSIGANFVHYDAFSMSNLFLNVSFNYLQNAIISSRTVEDNLLQSSTVTNVDGPWSMFMYAHYGRPFRPLRVRMNVSIQPNYNYGIEYVNAERNESYLFRLPLTLALDNTNKDVIDFQGGATFTFNDVRYTLNEVLNRSYVNRTFFGRASYEFIPNWRIMARMDYQMYSAEVFGSARNVPLLGAQLSWSVPGLRSELRLEGYDLLNQNLGVSFTNSGSYIREQHTASLGRHIMLKWVYDLTGQPSSQPPGITIVR